MIFTNSSYMNGKPIIGDSHSGQRFGEDDDMINDFANPVLDQHHDFSNFYNPQISPRASRSGTPGIRFPSYDRMFDSA